MEEASAQLAEAKVELEEIAESGDLEEQLEAALRIENLEAEFLRETGGSLSMNTSKSKKERRDLEATFPKCACGATLSLDRQRNGISECPTCETNRENIQLHGLLAECVAALEEGLESELELEAEWSKEDRNLIARVRAVLTPK